MGLISKFGKATGLYNTDFDLSDAIGITNPAPPDISKSPDAEALRRFAGQLTDEYAQRQPGVAPTREASTRTATTLDTTQSDQARAAQQDAINRLQGVAGGAPTSADYLYQRGVDAARANAAGMAAAYSRQNPGLALRAGLAAGNQASAASNATAAQLKAEEQARARDALAAAAAAMRGQDITAAGRNQDAANTASSENQAAFNQASAQNLGANLTQQQIDAAREDALRRAAAASLIAPFSATQANAQIQAQNDAANQTGIGSLISAGGNILGRR